MIRYMRHLKLPEQRMKKRILSPSLTMNLYPTRMLITSIEERTGNAQYVGQMMAIADTCIV